MDETALASEELHRRLRPEVQAHYDALVGPYTLLWGEHLHHGIFEDGASVRRAQERLIECLVGFAVLAAGCRVADIGCGVRSSVA
jgi:tocopherol O-methyltransferase